MYKVLRIVFTWFTLAVGLASAAVWDFSKWETWKDNTFLAHKVRTWNLWFTDVVPDLKNNWDVFVWDWGSAYTKVEHKLGDGHQLLRFSSFFEPNKWLAVWFNTWWDGNLHDTFFVWEYTGNEWVKKNLDVHEWASLVSGKWNFWKNLKLDNEDNFKLVPASWATLVLGGHANKHLSLAGKWHPNWWWTWQDGAWKFNWKKD